MPNIKNVEIFAVGTWNGDTYTEKDLDSIVDSFGNVGFDPPLKLGHTKDQKLLQKDGLPAAGWVKNVIRKGSKLYADFKDVPQTIYELLEKKAYKAKSVEIYCNYKDKNDKLFPRVLKAVALLGADIPAVEGLKDILALYDHEGQQYVALEYEKDEQKEEIPNMPKKDEGNKLPKKGGTEMEELKKKIAELESQLASANVKKMSSEKEVEFSKKLESLGSELKQTQQELAGEKHKNKIESVEKTVNEFTRSLKISPAQAPILKSLLIASSENEIKLFSKDGKEENSTIGEVLKNFISLQPDIFDAKEFTQKGIETDDIDARIRSYCKDNNLDVEKISDYKRAYAVVGSDA